MAEDLERLMHHARGDGPSPEFVAKLRALIVAETSPPGESTAPETVVDLDRRDLVKRPTIPRRMIGLAIAAAVVVIAGAIVVIAGSELSTIADEPPPFDAEATTLTDELGPVEAGTYLVDRVGTPFTISFDETRVAAFNSDGRLVVAHRDSRSFRDRTIEFTRLTALSDPSVPMVPPTDLEQGWPATDFDGWLDSVSEHVLVSNRRETTVGGLPAMRADLELGETNCQAGVDRCLFLGSNHLLHDVPLVPGLTYRVWVVDQKEEDPMAVVVAVNREADIAWFHTADTILSSLAFGEIGSNPALRISAGSTDLPFLGGVRVELEPDSVAVRDPGGIGRVALDDWNAATGFVTNPLDLDANALPTTDDVLRALRLADVEVMELGGTMIGSFEARVFDIRAEETEPVLIARAETEQEWLVPPRGRMWLVEHPDRGLLMITAQVYENLDLVFPLVVTQTERMIDSLAFRSGG